MTRVLSAAGHVGGQGGYAAEYSSGPDLATCPGVHYVEFDVQVRNRTDFSTILLLRYYSNIQVLRTLNRF
jgi:hypothetical protein